MNRLNLLVAVGFLVFPAFLASCGTGEIGSLEGAPRFGDPNPVDSGAASDADPASTGQCLGASPDVAARDGWRSSEASVPADGALSFEVKARPTAGRLDALVAVGGESIDDFDKAAITVRFAEDGLVDVRDGAVYASDVAYPYEPGVWYSIGILANTDTQSYDVEIGPCGEPRETLIKGASFRDDTASELSNWAVWSSQTAALEVSTPAWMTLGGCMPATCDSLGQECGQPGDGCGGTLDCGGCDDSQLCDSGVCVEELVTSPPPPACEPDTCESLGIECGVRSDGCGDYIACGGCQSGSSCNGGLCVADPATSAPPPVCEPDTCKSLFRDCGVASDGCGGALSCGGCGTGQTCTSWGSCVASATPPPVCVPYTCESLGRECGSVSNGCGGTLQCGGCGSGETCGSGVCVAAPSSGGGGGGVIASAATTGITDYWCPRWDSLRSVISSPGTTSTSRYEYVEYDGYAYVNADDVTMRCTYGHRANGQAILGCSDDGNPTTGCTQGLLVEDSQFYPTSPSGVVDQTVMLVTDEGALNRVHLVTGCDSMKMNGGIFENSFIDISTKGSSSTYCNIGDPHNDGIQLVGANYGPMWIMHNTIQGIDTSAIILCDGPMSDITAQNNRFSGGAWTTYLACDKSNTSLRASNWVGNEYIDGKWSVGPVDSSKVTGCFEAKTAGGAWANTYYPSGTPIDTEYFPGSSQNDGTCPRSSKWPRSWPDNAITNPPYWTVKSTTLPERSSCTRGNALCNDIDISASASGYTPRGSVTGYAHRWRYNCGGTSANTMNDGTEARTPCTRGHCLGGYQDDKADLWYDYPPCDGLASCTFANVCDFSAQGAGTYKVKVYSESGPGTGVRVSDHKEVAFTVNP